ncbi:YgfZ/GcvT domain-containing protein [Amphritea sp. HPY]|uniref:CAF17-like 4Fe-4S cluster assembly/insertion protein YgfZ n=1 Tax=Amphritea sp. HPY TaxID=3421652 RepID=UPI003D7F1086
MSWLDTLNALGVQVDDLGNCQLAEPQSGTTTVTPLTHLGIFDVTGPEAEKFLQGQLSCDIAEVAAGKSLLGSHCNIKGSMVSLNRLMPVDGGFWLRTEASVLPQGQANLNKYMMFSKAESKNISEQVVGLGIQGEQAQALLQSIYSSVPGETNQTTACNEGVLIRVPGDRFELWLPLAEAETLLPTLLQQAVLANSNSWRLSEIRNGIPTIAPETLETFIPQMTNLQVFGGVSFTKGCYTGQEIITRLQHRGKLKRPMFRLSVSTENAPLAGTSINSPDRAGVGTVVACAAAEEQRYELLAVMLKDSFDDQALDLTLETDTNAPLNRLDLPYQLDPELFESKR